tara:strand:+ start:6111 stop:6452 length:342 start_codon:yes stop_codon:yes gene_type:complete
MNIIDNIPTKRVYTEINLMVDDLGTYNKTEGVGSQYTETISPIDSVIIKKDDVKPHYISVSNNSDDVDLDVSDATSETEVWFDSNSSLTARIYISSVAVIGLFVFYRVLYKFK